jgi:serine/threonine protein kinase
MFKHLTCSEGHGWGLSVNSRLLTTPEWIVCPVCGAPPVSLPEWDDTPADRPPAGWTAPPGYELVKEIASDADGGIVYLARQLWLDRPVVLKTIPASDPAGAGWPERFRQEAKLLAAVQGPFIVQLHDAGERLGRCYLVLEHVPGGGLAERLRQGPLPPRQAAELLMNLTWAVGTLHKREILYLNLKPAHVLLGDDVPKLCDFSLARPMGQGAAPAEGTLVGTPAYMAPEQFAGRAAGIGPATDIHALGVLFYEMLTGRPPFRGESVLHVLRQVLECEPARPRALNPALPAPLEEICVKCLQKDPGRRYANTHELSLALTRFLHPPFPRPPGLWGRLFRRGSRA